MADDKKSSPTEIYFGELEENGDMRAAIILHTPGIIDLQSPDVQTVVPTTIKWNEATDSYTKTIEFEGEIIMGEYKLTVINKNTDKEEVTKLTLPNGKIINFEGWTV